MKKLNLIFIIFLTFSFWSCEVDKEKTKISETITANTMDDLTASSFTLLMADADDTFQTFSWTTVDFGFSAVVTYTVQVDVADNEFESAVDLVSVSNKLEAAITIGDMNKALLTFIDPDEATALEFRVKAEISDLVDPVYSSTVTATITPYSVVFPPIYMIGKATGGWDTGLAVEIRSSSSGIYSTIAYFTNSGSDCAFRFFETASWSATSYNYPYFTSVTASLLENAGDGDSNLRFIGTTGWYSITVNLNTKTVVMVAVDEPLMYMTGGGVGGWDWTDNYVKMTWKSDGVWSATTDFVNGGAFRFFAQKDWSPTSYNYPYFADGSVTDLLANAGDGDSNFSVVAASGNYTITVNLLELTVTMVAAR